MAKKPIEPEAPEQTIDEIIVEEPPQGESFECSNPACGHTITASPCPYCGR